MGVLLPISDNEIVRKMEMYEAGDNPKKGGYLFNSQSIARHVKTLLAQLLSVKAGHCIS